MTLAPDYMIVSQPLYDLYQFLTNTPPRELARHYLGLAREHRTNPKLHAEYLRAAHGYIEEARPKRAFPAGNDIAGWRAYYLRNDILFSRARGRKLSRVMRENEERYT